MIGYWHHNDICLSVTPCIVANVIWNQMLMIINS